MLTMTMATTAMAAEYNIDGPEDPLFASPTSVDQVTVVGGGVTEQSNIDRSKNSAVVPPPFGSPECCFRRHNLRRVMLLRFPSEAVPPIIRPLSL